VVSRGTKLGDDNKLHWEEWARKAMKSWLLVSKIVKCGIQHFMCPKKKTSGVLVSEESKIYYERVQFSLNHSTVNYYGFKGTF